MAIAFTVLGSGSKGNAIAIGCDGLYILIDAGFSRSELLKRMEIAGIAPDAVRAVLLTHEHTDHLKGARVFCNSLNIPLCLTAKTADFLRHRQALPGKILVFDAGDAFTIAGFEVNSFPIMHDAIDPVGYTVEHSGNKVGVATDIGVAGEGVVAALEGCHALLWESNYDLEMLRNSNRTDRLKRRIMGTCGHLGNLDSAKALGRILRSGTKTLILGHISRECNTYEIAHAVALRALTEMDRLDVALHVARQDEPLATVYIDEHSGEREYHSDLLVWAGCVT